MRVYLIIKWILIHVIIQSCIIYSIELLKEVGKIISDEGYLIGNIDATIIAQKPKMRPHIDEMRKNIADALNIEFSKVNIKATTEEGLGFTGKLEGISSQSICLLEKIDDYINDNYIVATTDENVMNSSVRNCSGCSGFMMNNKENK